MYDLTAFSQFSVGGKQYVDQQTISTGGLEALEEPIPIAWTGVLTTRTDNNTGTITMDNAGHIIATGNIIDIYWTVAGVNGVQRASTVGTVSGVTVPIDLGIGDNLPPLNSAVIACVVKKFTPNVIVGNNVAALLAAADSTRAMVCLYSSSDTVESLAITLAANGAYSWLGVGTNPIAGVSIDKIHISIADSVNVQNVRFAASINT